MTETFRLGRVAGVRVGVNWSVLVVFALIAYGLAGQRFPAVYPGLGWLAYATAGFLTAVAFFGSLLAHELAHALVARRNGVHVEGITLWLFGGVAKLQGEADDPGADLRIAGVGPLVSLVLGAAFGALAVILGLLGLGGTGGGGLFTGAVFWLGAINVALAVFNVIPAAPLDGGRLLRAIWWRVSGDRATATVRAAQAGQVFGWTLIVVGLFWFLTAQAFGGLWLSLIGWFLLGAATMEGREVMVRSRLTGVRAGDVMTPEPDAVPADMPVAAFLTDVLPRHRHSAFPVLGEDARPWGMVTLDQIRGVPEPQRGTTAIDAVACPIEDVARVRPEEPVADLLPRLTTCTGQRALVVDDGRLVGIISPRDVNRELERRDLTGARGGAPYGGPGG
jgi:Zn-dependent protease/CBS domain-containing protein